MGRHVHRRSDLPRSRGAGWSRAHEPVAGGFPVIVMKFGGTSVGTAASIRRVLDLVQRELPRCPLVVVSAFAKVTDLLLEIGRRAAAGSADTSAFESRHRDMLAQLELPADLLDPLLAEVGDLARGMKLVGEASPRAMDHLASYGERCSARVVAAFFSANGLPARAVDAFDAGLRTDRTFNRARPIPDDGRIARFFAGFDVTPVVTGFIAKDDRGNVTTLGRNGSDYSAALFGNAVDAEEIQIWTDVDGIMTADPKLVADARPIPAMSFEEASELAYYGGRVLHPASIQPAMVKSIPVRVLNTSRPESSGTLILAEYEQPGVPVRAVVYKRGIRLVNLVSPRMLQQHGFLARVFAVAARHEVDVDVVATSEVSVTMTTDSAADLSAFEAELGEIGAVSIEGDHALLCVVGKGIAMRTGIAAKVLSCVAEAGVAARVISQGAIRVNIALVIAEADLPRAVAALHAAFFPAAAAAR
jgi:aspartate kinase